MIWYSRQGLYTYILEMGEVNTSPIWSSRKCYVYICNKLLFVLYTSVVKGTEPIDVDTRKGFFRKVCTGFFFFLKESIGEKKQPKSNSA